MKGNTMIWPGSVLILVDSVSNLWLPFLLLGDRSSFRLYTECAKGIKSQNIFPDSSNTEISINFKSIIWPVLFTFHLGQKHSNSSNIVTLHESSPYKRRVEKEELNMP